MKTTTRTLDAQIQQLKARKANMVARENRKIRQQHLREAVAIGSWIKRTYPDKAVAILAKISEAKTGPTDDADTSSDEDPTSDEDQ